MTDLHIDIESYSEVDLRRAGLYRYAEHPSTEILMMAYALGDSTVEITTDPAEMLYLLDDELHNGVTFWAHNASFERVMLREVLGVDIPIERWKCTQVMGYQMALTGGLGDMVKAMGAPEDKEKLTEGRRLIRRFSKPQPQSHKVRRWTEENDPENWEKFKEYCRQDVEAERWLHGALQPYGFPEFIWDEYHQDQRINDEGVPLDVPFVEAAIKTSKIEKARLLGAMNTLTGLANSGSNTQIIPWLAEHGCEMENMQKDTVTETLKELPEGVARDVLQMKQKHSKTSVTKFNAMDRAVCSDGKLHGMFQFGGASRTLRWAGRIVQLQNLASPVISHPDLAAELITAHGADGVSWAWDVMDSLSSTVRSAIKAPEEMMILSPDLSSIESRGVGWLTGCAKINETFAKGLDTYKMYATTMYKVPYHEVTKLQRKNSKPPVLGGPYGLGAKGLVAYAEAFGIAMTEEEAQRHTDSLRSNWHEIPSFWRWVIDAVFKCTRTGIESKRYGLRVYAHGEFLRIELPSGRSISYHRPKIVKRKAPWGDVIDNFSFMGKHRITGKWCRITAHGGFMLENITQAWARDVLGVWMTRCQKHVPGCTIIGHVHDEIMALAKAHEAEAVMQQMIEQARRPIPWAPGLILDADGEGFPAKRFRK